MTVSNLDPKSALIVIDLQKGLMSEKAPNPIDEVVKNSARLAHAFRRRNLPVVLVNVVGGAPGRTAESARRASRGRRRERPEGWTELVPELDQQPSDHTVTKRTWGAFTNTGLAETLRSADVTQVVITGVATSIGVESTARQAHELGFNVALATDAMSDSSADAHFSSVTRIFPRLGEVGTSQEIIDLLEQPPA
jgi:nicotinamidase-related amidase